MTLLKRLDTLSKEMQAGEDIAKLIAVLIIEPIPILFFGLGGALLGRHLDSIPLLLTIGLVVGTLLSAWLVYQILIKGHKEAK
jgi:hypothetical protein